MTSATPGDALSGELPALLDGLVDPDPDDRERALAELVSSWEHGWDEPTAASVGTRSVALLSHQEIQARSFGALALSLLAERGPMTPEWVADARQWYATELDLRGWDPERGWLHAVAHGADLIGALGRYRRAPAGPLLATLSRRLVTPTEFIWCDHEDDRLARALALVLSDPTVDETTATAWLGPVERLLAEPASAPARPEQVNALHTVRSLALALHTQIIDAGGPVQIRHRQIVLDACVRTGAAAVPWLHTGPVIT